MPRFEFVVEGPAVSLRASNKSRSRYRKWVLKVRSAAERSWRAGEKPTSDTVEVAISNYYTAAPPDVDNVVKPILDALKGLVYNDDGQVQTVTSRKIELQEGLRFSDPGSSLAAALQVYTELLHVGVTWEEGS